MNYWFLYKKDGSIYGSPYRGDATEWTSIPDGCAVLGPIDATTASSTVQDAYTHPSYYVVQSGELIAVSNIAELQLADAKQAKNTEMQQAYGAAMATGFQSTADGTSRTYPGDSGTINELLMMRSMVTSADFPAAGVRVKDITGAKFVLTQSQATTLINDAQTFFLTNRDRSLTVEDDIEAAATAADVQAVTW